MPRKLVIALALFAAVSALGGSTLLLLARHGSPVVPLSLIRFTPFDSFLIPGLLLAVVGAASSLCALLAWRRSRAAVDVAGLAGGAMTVWIVAEAALMRTVHWLHLLYGGVGLLLLALALREAFRSPRPRHHWVATVTLAEAAGFLAPALAGIWLSLRGASDLERIAPMAAAGLIEGLALGAGQARVFPLRLDRARFTALTGLGAAAVWVAVLAAMLLLARQRASPALVVPVALGAATIGLLAIGGAQWLELRRHAARAWRWIAWTALAWLVALPLAFAPGPLVDETTPLAAHVALWGAGGLLMAYVMSLITWQGVRRLAGEREMQR